MRRPRKRAAEAAEDSGRELRRQLCRGEAARRRLQRQGRVDHGCFLWYRQGLGRGICKAGCEGHPVVQTCEGVGGGGPGARAHAQGQWRRGLHSDRRPLGPGLLAWQGCRGPSLVPEPSGCAREQWRILLSCFGVGRAGHSGRYQDDGGQLSKLDRPRQGRPAGEGREAAGADHQYQQPRRQIGRASADHVLRRQARRHRLV
mmetsp:Transcript_67465/g.193899  ORF Transcript_67465/g.193899 Transcript_67465/m.193899 type:complete len:202 (-) Transcript_67465:844-1449(-)